MPDSVPKPTPIATPSGEVTASQASQPIAAPAGEVTATPRPTPISTPVSS